MAPAMATVHIDDYRLDVKLPIRKTASMTIGRSQMRITFEVSIICMFRKSVIGINGRSHVCDERPRT